MRDELISFDTDQEQQTTIHEIVKIQATANGN